MRVNGICTSDCCFERTTEADFQQTLKKYCTEFEVMNHLTNICDQVSDVITKLDRLENKIDRISANISDVNNALNTTSYVVDAYDVCETTYMLGPDLCSFGLYRVRAHNTDY